MITIREETYSDISQIQSMYVDIYHHCLSQNSREVPTNHLVIKELRASGALLLSLVAELEGKVVGHIAFSPVRINGNKSKWVKLGPVKVDLKHQKQGIGAKLVNEGLDQIRLLHYDGVVVPEDRECFKQFGFSSKPTMKLHDAPTKHTYAISLNATPPAGKVSFHPAFSHNGNG